MARDRRIPLEAIRGCDLQIWHIVICECWACKHERVMPHGPFKRRDRADKPLSDLKFRCQWCGEDGPHKLTVEALPKHY